jgi:hypothetical protein
MAGLDQEPVEYVPAFYFDTRAVRTNCSRVNVGYSTEFRPIRELHVDETPSALVEDLDPDVDLEVGALCGVVVELAFSKKDSGIGFGIADRSRCQLKLLGRYRPPICRTCPFSPTDKGEQKQQNYATAE